MGYYTSVLRPQVGHGRTVFAENALLQSSASPCRLQRLQRAFAVLQRALPGGFCKPSGKIAGIPKANFLCNLVDAVVGKDQ